MWLARWLREQDIDAYVIHPTSIPVSREHRRAKSDRLDLRLLLRAFLGWLRGEPGHCSMVAIPTVEEEDGKRPLRERETLTGDVTRLINRMKSLLVRHGIRDFKVTLKKAGEKLAAVKTAWGNRCRRRAWLNCSELRAPAPGQAADCRDRQGAPPTAREGAGSRSAPDDPDSGQGVRRRSDDG